LGGKLLAALRADHLIETDPADFRGRNDFAALRAYRIQRSEDFLKIHFLSREHMAIFSQEKSPTGGGSLGKWRSVFLNLLEGAKSILSEAEPRAVFDY
jgi:hypothetical protein